MPVQAGQGRVCTYTPVLRRVLAPLGGCSPCVPAPSTGLGEKAAFICLGYLWVFAAEVGTNLLLKYGFGSAKKSVGIRVTGWKWSEVFVCKGFCRELH